MRAHRRAGLRLIALALVLAAAPAGARAGSLKLWPLFEYEHDEAAGTRTVKALGPLIEYRSDPGYYRLMLRPVLSIRQARGIHDDEVDILYPLLTSRWAPLEQSTTALGGLLKYTTATTEDGRVLTRQRLRALPFYFYDWDFERGGRVSLVPFYADVEDLFGFDRVEMLAFPAYLRLRRPLVDRRYLPFPFVGTVDGELGSGHNVWPLYGHTTLGATADSGFVLWPFYQWESRTSEGESERRFTSFPFYARLSGPRRESTAYGTILWVHTIDRAADQESWGFPWPLWTYERSSATERRLLRVWPLYENSRQRPPDSFSLPTLYRYRTFSDAGLEWSRGDALFFVLRNEHSVNRSDATERHVEAVVPVYQAVRDAAREDGGAPALLDGIWPENDTLRSLYAPLWQAYAWDGPVGAARWSVAWNAVTHDATGTHGPWRWAPSAETERAVETPER
jgi:hypothetical protein